MQIKTTRCGLMTENVLKLKRLSISSVGEGVEQLALSNGSIKWYNHFGKHCVD
jgi:hypothetical protein